MQETQKAAGVGAGPALVPPYPYFGSKRAVASLIWQALGNVGVYVEPFLGSGSILLARPTAPHVETVNDWNAFLTNFWRALQADPDGVAQWASYPVSELDMQARHRWLMAQEDFREQMRRDPDYYDVKLAGWWVWGTCAWIGHGWCQDGFERRKKIPNLQHAGNGIHQQRPMVGGNTPGLGINQHKKRPMVAADRSARGIQGTQWHQRPMCQGDDRPGIFHSDDLHAWFAALATRLRRVRICCGDWRRVLTPVVLNGAGVTGIVLDPPYSQDERDERLYGEQDDTIATEVAQWARTHGENPKYRIVLCGYDTEHEMPGWTKHGWQANGGYGNQRKDGTNRNRKREVLWLSPYCETITTQLSLFSLGG